MEYVEGKRRNRGRGWFGRLVLDSKEFRVSVFFSGIGSLVGDRGDSGVVVF